MHSDADKHDATPEHSGQEVPAGEAGAAPEGAAAEIAELKDKLLRTLAEGENMRRRLQKEREDTAKYAVASFARDMLTVADNLRRALDATAGDSRDPAEAIHALMEGVGLTERDMLSALERHGIRKIDPAGQRFNHEQHEAMFEVPTAEVPPGTVVQVVEVGYMIHDRLLRPARVGIAKALPGEGGRVDTTA